MDKVFRTLAHEVSYRINDTNYFFTFTSDGVCVKLMDAHRISYPDFAKAFAIAISEYEKLLFPKMDKDGAFGEIRDLHRAESYRVFDNVAYHEEKGLYAKNGIVTVEVLTDTWHGEQSVRYLQFGDLELSAKMVNNTKTELERTYRNRLLLAEQETKLLADAQKALKDERSAFEEEKRLWRQMQAILSDASNSDIGYVYLLFGGDGRFKIGKSIDPAKRLAQFQIGSPDTVRFEVVIATGRMSELESNLHAQFKDKRIRGEWFMLSDEDVNFIKSLA